MPLPPTALTDHACTVDAPVVRRSPASSGGRTPLLVDWAVRSHGQQRQLGYHLESAATPDFDQPVSEGPVEGEAQLAVAAPGGPLRSREVRYLRVRVATPAGWSAWSPPGRVEAALLEARDWQAVAVTLPGDPGDRRQAPAPLLRTSFTVPGRPVRARLHATSLGVHELRLNGRRVGDGLLAPGWTPYHRRLLVMTHDVTDLLREGENALGAMLGDGWYRGRLGWDPDYDRCRYGSTLALLAQLEVDLADGGHLVVGTGPRWRAATGEVLRADLYDGCRVDLRRSRPGWDQPGFDDGDWHAVEEVPLDLGVLEPAVTPPVRPITVLSPVPLTSEAAPGGRAGATPLVFDAGQNVAGFVRLTVRGRPGDEVVVRHAEVLEADGSLHTRSLRSARATDEYVLAGEDVTVLEPVFTFHGFRFAEVRSTAEVLAAEVVAISTDTAPRSGFSCSEPALERLHENVRWSQRDNFVSVPTDCPQRDERLGWTGDAQVFAATACTLTQAREFWASWLRDLAADQAPDGSVPSVVPHVPGVLRREEARGRSGWADAATIVPWAVHEAYDDLELLHAQRPSMQAWVDHLARRRGPDGIIGEVGFQFGDWLDPDAPGDRPHEAKTADGYLVNAFFAHSARLLARTCSALGDVEAAAAYARLAEDVAGRTWARWRDHALQTQTGCAIALEFAIAPPEEVDATGRALAGLVRERGGAVATGFLGTPLVLPALARTGHLAEAYLMLLRRQMPSWLYQVAQGATTVWERWDAIGPDGTIHDGVLRSPDGDGHMLSFNHYAYGAVADWLYRTLAGLAPDADRPGYRHVILAPRPVEGVDAASAWVESGYGRIEAAWQVDAEGTFHARYDLPFGVSGTVLPPATPASRVWVDGVDTADRPGPVTLGPGRHEIGVTAANVVQLRLPVH